MMPRMATRPFHSSLRAIFLGSLFLGARTSNAAVIERDSSSLSPAANASLPTNWTYVGCYNDTTASRTLSGVTFADANNMNGSVCAAYCAKKNFVYAGTEYADECYCGNLLAAPSSLQDDSSCSMACSGSPSEACGAANYLSVYYANKAAPKGPSVNPGPPGWTSFGCWTDGTTRTLAHGTATPGDASSLTVALCTTACGNAGYTLAGMEYAGECYCDNNLANSATNVSLSDCNMPCNGNASEFCGAGNRLNLYASGNTVPSMKPAPKASAKPVNWIDLGCYSDNSQSRTLSNVGNVVGGTKNMTNANCVTACSKAGYTIAGTEDSGECWCDNNIQNNAGPAADGSCNTPCNGNSKEICGGANGLSVLQFNGWSYAGCYVDSVQSRTLNFGQAIAGGPQSMSVEACVGACQKNGYTIAGMEYSGECYCDNQLDNGGGLAPDGEAQCNMPCYGNADETCGGSNRLSVYTFNGRGLPTTTPPSNPIQTTANPPTATGGDPGQDPPVTSSSALPTPSSPVDPNSIAPFKYMGCYTDTGNGRSVTQQPTPDNQTMTVEYCVSVCKAGGYTIAALQYSVQCFCDYYLYSSPSRVDDSECDMPCGGNPGEDCGAGGRNSIYASAALEDYIPPGPLKTLPTDWIYSGCYADNTNNMRMFPYQLDYETNNSNTYCIATCQQYGYSAAGTEYADQCYCGDVSDMAAYPAVKLDESACFMRCRNDTVGSNGGEICGGGGSISVYTWTKPRDIWTYASGNAAGAYEFLIGGVVIPLLTQPTRNGKVVFLEKFGTEPSANTTGAYELDLAQLSNFTGAWRPMHVKTDIFCSAGLTLPDKAGRLINVGGWSLPSTEGIRLYIPDGKPGVWGTNDWEENVNEVALLDSRWYPSAMIMANGSILVMGGEDGSNGAPTPSLELLPPTSSKSQYCDYLEETDPYNLYPFLITLPSGNIFVGFFNQAKLLDPVSLQPIKSLPMMPGSVTNQAGAGRTYPLEGAAVILPQIAPYTDPLQVLICGGSTNGAMVALDNCLTIEPDSPNADWTLERMPSKRVMPCFAALPDGTYLIANGAHQGNAGFGLANDPNLNAILYDPSKPVGRRMTVMANTTVARLYHSEAVLMDDARVLISGSDPEDLTHLQEYRVEVFIPPYLMGAPARPAFSLADVDWTYGGSATLSITAQGAGGPFRVSMMGSVSSTHGNSMGQRTFFPAVACSGSACTVTAPPNANVCPPGWFQVFLLDGKGVPSHATWVRVGGDPAELGNWPNAPGFTMPGMGAVEPLY